MGNTLVGAMDEPQSPEQVGHEIRLLLFGQTDVGQIREHNEDNFLIADLSRPEPGLGEEERELILSQSGMVLAVCDGMGGAAAGEVASKMAVEILHEKLHASGTPENRDALARRLVSAIKEAGIHIFQDGRADRKLRGMGTTATVAALVDDRLFLGQVGDSRAYVLRGSRLVQVTRDQSLVNQLIEAGQLTAEEAETFEHNNIILQALGTADVVQVDLTYVDLRRGDTLLMCSDGLSGMLRGEEIREVLVDLEDPRDACRELVERANQAGGHDNVTVLVAKFEGNGLSPCSEHDTLAYAKYTPGDGTADRETASPNSGGADSHGFEDTTARNTLEDYEPAQEEPTEISGTPANERAARETPGADSPSVITRVSQEPGSDALSLAGAVVLVALGAVALLGVWLLR